MVGFMQFMDEILCKLSCTCYKVCNNTGYMHTSQIYVDYSQKIESEMPSLFHGTERNGTPHYFTERNGR